MTQSDNNDFNQPDYFIALLQLQVKKQSVQLVRLYEVLLVEPTPS